MIPILYNLRSNIRFEEGDAFSLVVSEVPLNVVRASRRAARILGLCDGKRTLRQIAGETGVAEERVFRICDYFNKKAVLDTLVLENRGYFPFITVIIPTRDRGKSLVECLGSVFAQDYPPERFEVLVIDDGSLDETRKLASAFRCKIFAIPESRGQSYCRNLGALHASGEILAFLDNDCVAGPSWLRDLAPYLSWDAAGAVGGYVDGYSDRSTLDRYEKEFSLLNLGKYIQRGGSDRSVFYLPMCNLLVRREAFAQTGGLRETLQVGEDVDFCWRMQDAGWQALYVPAGAVKHKHRNTLGPLLRRRADYGGSEAVLYGLHPERRKSLQISLLPAAAFLGLCVSIVLFALWPLLATAGGFAGEAAAKLIRLRRINIPTKKILSSVLRTYLSYSHIASFHLIRYYLILLLVLGFVFPMVWLLAFSLLAFVALMDYSRKQPRLCLLLFFLYYSLDQMAYQAGAIAGCIRARSFRSYMLRFQRTRKVTPQRIP
jgi:mycofactocin system glycosyltransferase